MPKLFMLILLCTLSATGSYAQQNMSHGTALALVRTNDEIVIATDSRLSDGNLKVLPDICKIWKSGDLYFSMVGLASFRGVDFAAIVSQSLKSSASIAERVQSIRLSLTPILEHALQLDGAVRSFAAENGSVMGVLIYGFDHGVLVVSHVRFALRDPQHLEPQVRSCPGQYCPDGRVAITAPPNKVFDWSIPPAIAARKLVQAEIDKGNFDIGGPLQLMRIDRNGDANWIEKPQVCKGIK